MVESIILAIDYSARDYLADQRDRLGALYVAAMCAQGAFEQEARNIEQRAQFDASYPAMVRLYDHPPLPVRSPTSATVVQIRIQKI